MPPKKARFGNRGKGKGGKGKGKGGSRYDYYGYRDDDRGYGSRSDWGDDQYDDWGGYSSWDRGGRDDRWSSRDSWGPSAANPRDRDRFVTQMMEDDRYEWRKQNDPDFVSGATSGGSASNPHEAGKDDEGADDEIFDAALEKRRKHRREMKDNTHSKLDRLVDVAARLDYVEEELAKVANGKAPDDKLLTRAEWETIKQRSAEKGQKARANAEREYEERKQKRDRAEQARIDRQIAKRADVARNLDEPTEGVGFFASICEAPLDTNKEDLPLKALEYLRERLTTANSKETLHGTRLNAPMGPIASGITKLANLIHRQVLSEERHVASLESLKDEFGIGTTAATTPGLLKAFLNVLYVRTVDVLPEDIGVVLPRDFGK